VQAFLKKYHFILKGIGILAVFYVAFAGRNDSGKEYFPFNTIFVRVENDTKIGDPFTIFSFQNNLRYEVELNDLSKTLVNKDTLIKAGSELYLTISHRNHYRLFKKNTPIQSFEFYGYWNNDIAHPSWSEYNNAIIKNNWSAYNQLFISAFYILLFLDLCIKKKEEILERLDEFASKVNAKTDSITLGSTEYQLYRDHLIEIGYRGQFKRPIIRKRFIEKLKEPTYTLKSEKYVLLRYFLIALLGLTFVFISKNGPFQEKLTTVIPLLILQLLSGVIYIGSNKVKKELIISNKGIKQSGKEFIPWSLVEFVYLYKGDKDIPISLLLKAYDYNEPAIVDISGLSMSPKKIGHLVATFIEN